MALVWRLNIPAMYGTTCLFTNPFTAVPVYYFAYRVGAAVLGTPRQNFRFIADLHWFRHGLVPVWRAVPRRLRDLRRGRRHPRLG